MKVHFLTENALEALRTNLKKGNLRHYADETNDWIFDYFGAENPKLWIFIKQVCSKS